MGNRMIMVASETAPLIATDLYQILDTSDVPAGAVNILTGSHSELALHMASHMEIDAVWSFSHSDISNTIQEHSVTNLKRTWVNHGYDQTWASAFVKTALPHATEPKTIWIPFAEG